MSKENHTNEEGAIVKGVENVSKNSGRIFIRALMK